MAPDTAEILYVSPDVLEQTLVLPDIAPGVAGAALMVMVYVCCVRLQYGEPLKL